MGGNMTTTWGPQPYLPGPWETQWVGNTISIRSPKADKIVCKVMQHRATNNVNLLLAAPEMVEALEAIALAHTSGDRDRLDEEIHKSIDVLCKAKGC